MNILVTGGTGFIGEYFIPRLLEEKHSVTLLVRNIEKAKKLFGNKVNYVVGDITDKESLKGCCMNIDMIYHMVAKVGNDLPSEKNFEEFKKVNVDGTRNLVETCKMETNIKKFIYISSIAALGIVKDNPITENTKANPFLPYQVSKYDAEQYLLREYNENGFPSIILRPTKVYGIGEHEYSFLKQFKLLNKGINIKIGLSENYISNVCVKDLVNSFICCIDNGEFGEIYNISGKDSISAKDFSQVYSSILHRRIITITVPKLIMSGIAFVEERLFILMKRRPIVTLRNVMAVSTNRVYDLNKSQKELKYSPNIDMESGIRLMYSWYKSEQLL